MATHTRYLPPESTSTVAGKVQTQMQLTGVWGVGVKVTTMAITGTIAAGPSTADHSAWLLPAARHGPSMGSPLAQLPSPPLTNLDWRTSCFFRADSALLSSHHDEL